MNLTRIAALAVLTSAVLAVTSCSSPPEPAVLQALADGYWHGSHGEHDFIYAFRLSGGALAGEAHQIEDGRQRTAAPMVGVSIDGTSIELRYAGLPPYRGEIDLEAGRILGGHPDSRFDELNLDRVDPTAWPMVAAKPPPAADGAGQAWTRPADRDDGWQVATPEEVGIDPAAIEATLTAILAGEAGWMHSLLIVRRDRLVVEEYFHGWQADALHRLASCTKSVDSLLIGIAIDRGEIAGVEVPLLDFFPDHRARAGAGWQALRLEHLLTMSMGLDWTAEEAERFPRPDQDPFADVIVRDVRTEPGSEFRYVSRNTNLLSMVLLQTTGLHADRYAAEHLFAPLGIDSWDWETGKYEGHPAMSGTLKMRPRDMARIGKLVLDQGMWGDRRVVSSDWLRRSTSVYFRPSANDEYGYLWWGFDEPPPGVDFAMGKGSQYILAAPALDLVLVATGGNEFNDKQTAILEVIKSRLAPGLS